MARGRKGRAGFTLIEVLAVLVILGILVTLLVTQLRSGREAAEIERTRHLLAMLSAAIDHYELEFGDYPASTFPSEAGVAADGTNVGAEALVAALWSEGWEAGGLLDRVADRLGNVDGDFSPAPLTDFESRELFEIVDAWENPVAYVHRRDYEGPEREYVTVDPDTGETMTSLVGARRNPVTRRFYAATRFQLLSAGPDGRFGTEDDVTSFDG